MKKITFLTILGLLFSIWSYAQVVTTIPTFVTQNDGQVTVIFDATQGDKGLMGYTGTDVYAYTGVVTSTSNGAWTHTPTSWLDNDPKYAMTSLGNNKWQLIITPTVAGYYGLSTSEVATKMAFVFRNSTGTKTGRDIGGADIFVPVYQQGLNVSITSPATDKAVTQGTSDTVQVSSSVVANLELFVNGTSVQTALSTTSLSYPITYSSTSDYQLIAKATAGTTVVYDTVNVCVPAPVTTMTRPAGVQDGITYSADGTSATLVLNTPTMKQDGTVIPSKNNVFVLGDFNNWVQKNAYQMYKDGDYWWITITGLTPGKLYGFQYLVDGTIRIADAYSELILDPWNDKWINQYSDIYPDIPAYPEGKTTGLVGTLQSKKPVYNWQVTNFTLTNPDNMVIYELLVRDFTSEKSLAAAITKLDYLKTLGVTAVELMPVQEFDGNNSWGYNPNAYFAPDKAYGTPDMYRQFIDECHKRGIAVFLDMVFNQAFNLHPFAMLYWDSVNNRPAADNPWMNPVAPHLYSVFNDFNHSFTGTREYLKRVLKYWLTEYKVDGYRMDLSKGFTQSSGTESLYDQNRINYLTEYYNAVKEVRPDAAFILEHFVGGTEEDNLAAKGMYLWRNMNYAYSQSAMGWNTGADFSGMNSNPRKWVGYAESHDEERNFYNALVNGNGVIKTDSIVRIGRVPLNIAFTVLTPGPKMIWQFGEMGYDYSINSLGGRTSPKPSAFGWLDLAHRKAAYDKSSKIITLKKLYPNAFLLGNYKLNISESDWYAGKIIVLTHSDLNMVMLGNFQPSGSIAVNPGFPKTGMWYELLTGEELNVSNTNMSISVNAGDVKIYTDIKVNIGSGVSSVKAAIDCTIYPNVTSGKIWISTPAKVENVIIYNVQGALQRSYNNMTEIDASDLSSGMYLMEINTDKGKATEKFVKR
ncbi:MAG: alpha-amylase family glycosyl hydrolase [Paludibacteraceae bacterium]